MDRFDVLLASNGKIYLTANEPIAVVECAYRCASRFHLLMKISIEDAQTTAFVFLNADLSAIAQDYGENHRFYILCFLVFVFPARENEY